MDTLFKDVIVTDICREKDIVIDDSTVDNNIDKTYVFTNTFDAIIESNRKKALNRGTGVILTSEISTSNPYIKSTQKVVKEKQQEELKEISRISTEFPYKRVPLLTDAELQLFNFMSNNLCQKDRIIILTKVRLADLANIDERVTTDKSYFWKITNKHVDFLICKKDTLDVICAVELDDYTHESQEAKEKDMFIMQVLDTVGIKTVRIRTKIRLISKNDLVLIDDYINRALAPKCPYCGKQMYPKQSRTGHRFYACVDFINCRKTIDIDPRGVDLP